MIQESSIAKKCLEMSKFLTMSSKSKGCTFSSAPLGGNHDMPNQRHDPLWGTKLSRQKEDLHHLEVKFTLKSETLHEDCHAHRLSPDRCNTHDNSNQGQFSFYAVASSILCNSRIAECILLISDQSSIYHHIIGGHNLGLLVLF